MSTELYLFQVPFLTLYPRPPRPKSLGSNPSPNCNSASSRARAFCCLGNGAQGSSQQTLSPGLSPDSLLSPASLVKMPLTSTREATAALSKEPAQRGTSGVSLIAALHAAARTQRSGMARAPAGMRAQREETSAPPASQVPFPPVALLLLRHPGGAGTYRELGHLRQEGGAWRLREGLRGAEFQGPAVCWGRRS